MTATYDPTTDESLDDLMTAGKLAGSTSKSTFVEIAVVDVWDCVLQRGAGKVPFDPTIHPAERRCVAISMLLRGTRKDGSTYDIKQDDISSGIKFSETLPSLKALGVSGRSALAGLAGKWAQVERVDTGDTYAAKKASADGKIKVGDPIAVQSIKFLALYDSAEACKAAEDAFYAPRGGQAGDGRNVPQPLESEAVDAQARAMLLKSVPMLWQAAGANPVTFAAMLGANPQYAALGLTPESDEVLHATGRAAGMPF
jgi:hypothetical protein